MSNWELTEKAKRYAEIAHKGQVRKLNSEQFMIHPNNVANKLKSAGFNEIVVAAGFLHDVIEDTSVTIDELRNVFGEKVLQLVLGNTEDMQLSWKERKLQTIERAKVGTLELKALIAADKLDNIMSILSNYKVMGEKVWQAFSRGKEDQYWYYSEVEKSLFKNIKEADIPAFFYDYRQFVQDLKQITH